MAMMTCSVFSDVLRINTGFHVILPRARGEDFSGNAYPTLYLLHGLSDDHTAWLRRTSIERYVEPLGLAVVMPDVHRGFYTDMAHGNRYWTFVSDELPRLARGIFPLSDRREETFVAGLSMGGYGAFKLALGRPESFAAAASLSGALDVGALFSREDPPAAASEDWLKEMEDIFGPADEVPGSDNDLFHLAEKVAGGSSPKPRLFQCCGLDDQLLDSNHRFKRHAEALGLDLTYTEGPGEHEWGYWDTMIREVLEWLPLPER